MSETWTFAVTGMHCGSCGLLIDDALEDVDGVLAASTSVKLGVTTVRVDPTRTRPDAVVAAITAEGYAAEHTA